MQRPSSKGTKSMQRPSPKGTKLIAVGNAHGRMKEKFPTLKGSKIYHNNPRVRLLQGRNRWPSEPTQENNAQSGRRATRAGERISQ